MDSTKLTKEEKLVLHEGNLEGVRAIVDRGISFGEPFTGLSALHFCLYSSAIKYPRHESFTACIRFLIEECGVPVNRVDDNDKTPLHYAVRTFSDIDTIDTLLELGADPNAIDHRKGTPLAYALGRNPMQWETAVSLVDAGAELYTAPEGVIPMIERLRNDEPEVQKRVEELGW